MHYTTSIIFTEAKPFIKGIIQNIKFEKYRAHMGNQRNAQTKKLERTVIHEDLIFNVEILLVRSYIYVDIPNYDNKCVYCRIL